YETMTGFLPAEWKAKVHPFRVEPNSDHWPFFERGIPSFFAVTSGDHPNYHTPSDDAPNLKPECLEAAARVVGTMVGGLGNAETPLSTGKELPRYLLHEGPHAVEGPASAKALAQVLSVPRGTAADRGPLVRPGWSCVILPVDEAQGGAALAWARVSSGV